MAESLRASYCCQFLHVTAVEAGGFNYPCGRTNRWHQPAPTRLRISKCLGVLISDQSVGHPKAEIHPATTACFESADVVERGLHERVHESARVVIWLWLKREHQVHQPVPFKLAGNQQFGVNAEEIAGVAPQMNKGFSLHSLETVAEAGQTIENANRKHQ